MSNDIDEFAKYFFVVVAIAAAVAFSVLLIVALPFVAVAALPLGALYIAYIWYRDDPNRAESQQRKLLQEAYERTKGASLSDLSDDQITAQLGKHIGGRTPETVEKHLLKVGRAILNTIDLDTKFPRPPSVANSIEGGRYLDRIAKISTLSPEYVKETIEHVALILSYVAELVPEGTGTHKVPARYFIKDQAKVVTDIIDHIFTSEAMKPLRDKLDENLVANKSVMPEEYEGDDILDVYFKNTPLAGLFDFDVPFSIPTDIRFEHQVVIAASGDGKTTLFESMICDDLEEDACIVVIDSQKTIIRKLSEHIDPDRLVLISPDTLPALNLYANAAQDELSTNRAMALYDFIFESRGETFTQKQADVYRNLSRLCMVVPGANLATLRDMCEPGFTDTEEYREHISKLSKNGQSFFKVYNLKNGDYSSTKPEVRRRIGAALDSPTFAKMFESSTMKLDMLKEIEQGKVILVNTDFERLQAGTPIFGKLLIGLVLQAVQSRAEGTGKRVYMYIDEFGQDYAQDSELLLRCFTQARKANLGLIIAIQGLSQLPEKLRASISTNTAIKIAGTVSAEERAIVAKQMNTTVDTLSNQPPYTFTAYFKRYGTFPWKVSKDRLLSRPQNSPADMEALYSRLRHEYGDDPQPPTFEADPKDDEEEFEEKI